MGRGGSQTQLSGGGATEAAVVDGAVRQACGAGRVADPAELERRRAGPVALPVEQRGVTEAEMVGWVAKQDRGSHRLASGREIRGDSDILKKI